VNNNNYYQIYYDQVIKLAETIVIKSEATANGLNNYVASYFGAQAVDTATQHSWKYYLNISGEYHPTDEVMHVVSSDTLETIAFTKQNLLVHLATARDYQYGTRQYNELVATYPKQEMLILGVLYPVNIDAAINAKDGAILGYPPDLVEPNEYTLIEKLQGWIDGMFARWNIPAFGLSDSLYPAAFLGILYLNLVPAIMNYRLEACKTNEAHSFHVKQYLASHGMLDAYIGTMTLKQTLFFYRNIAYIERNSGQKNIFEWLVEKILTDRNIPLAEYTMRHDVSNQPGDLSPTLAFLKKSINGINSIDQKTSVTLDELLSKQDNLARDNLLYKPLEKPVIKQQMENSLSNVVLTKTLESSMIDYSKSHKYSLEEILINQWVALAATDKYIATVGITNPRNGERIPMSAKEAYIFAFYAFCRSVGIDPATIPAMTAKRVQNIKLT
jgi:hypothetical protein